MDTEHLEDALRSVAYSITDMSASSGLDAADGRVGCLTEAVMGNTAAMVMIANALMEIAAAIRQR